MFDWAIYTMIYLGSALMVYNIYGFIRFAGRVQRRKDWGRERTVLYIPIVLLVLFLLGYLAVGIFGKPDLIISGILFGGSIFVFIMFNYLQRIIGHVQENEQMQAKLMAAEASNRAKMSFLSRMSHEMRTPMNAIIGLDALALRADDLAPQTRERLEKIGISARHMMELINDVLDMSIIDSEQIVLRDEAFSLRETLRLVNLLVQTQCDAQGLEYRSEVSGSVGDAFRGDAMHIRQLLLNILGNAVKFTPPPGTVSFSVEQLPEEGGRCPLRFTISDTGIGMDQEFLTRIFEPFSQEDASTTNRYAGSGLGLAITKRLAEMMGGTIAVTSRKGEGSSFVVTLPLERIERAEQAGLADPGEVTLSGCRVLIAEDIDINAEILADLLEMEEIASERAENGKRAVEMFSAHGPGYYDAILMDLRMPVMDGLDATRAIRALERPDARSIPIIALTANAFEEDVRQSLEAGMDAHMAKPADSEMLCDELRELIAKRRGR